ncbi:response regulator transcription factor [Variovorax saccharolyticus]|uniref:response regulator transcription factor n=1 Tax=Variovorax saccharolyticus TaxID=3053516 RepID=UPI002574F126|nr:LuxR C-terminal-related transcriptional regulator [Variovorax sp. J31P216]MDM0029084.1 LuxR C-terminal-related transcriptional regulator [Variovorax sp. J31P216]
MEHTNPCSRRPASETLTVPTVFIVEPDASIRERLTGLVESAGWHSAVAASAEEFLDRPRVVAASCLVVEQHLPCMSGLELQRLVADRREMPVIVTSRLADIRTTVKAMKAGAFEFLEKPVAEAALLRSIKLAIKQACDELDEVVRIRELERRWLTLSSREREVMRLIVTGRLNKEVGADLFISEITVKAHRGSVMRKMRARSFAQLIGMGADLSSATPPLQLQ